MHRNIYRFGLGALAWAWLGVWLFSYYPLNGQVTAKSVSGRTFYVAQKHPQASDSNPGTETQPWLTIQKAAATASAGDTVIVREGVYDEKLRFAHGGTADAPITYKAHGKEAVAIDYSGTDDHVVLFTKPYIVMDGFQINSARYQPIRLNPGSHHVIIRNCELTGAVRKVVKCPKCGEDVTVRVGEGISFHGLLIEDASVHHITIQNNKIHGHGMTRLHHGLYIKGDHHLVEGNIIHGNAHAGIHMYDSAGSVKHCVVRNNIIHGNGLRSGSGPGIIVCQGGNLIYNNICYGNGGHGIFVYKVPAADPPNEIYNNILYGNGRAGLQIEAASNTIAKNNIIANNKQQNVVILASSNVVLDHNCYWPDGDGRFLWGLGGGRAEPPTGATAKRGASTALRGGAAASGGVLALDFAGWKAQSGQDAHSLCQDPLFVDAKKSDFCLRADSPCVDAGATVGVDVDFDRNKRPQGRGFDIGAFER